MDRKIKTAQSIANLLDNRFKILGFKFGLDPIIGLIPGLGDLLPFLFSTYLVLLAMELNMPQRDVLRMVGNIILDLLIGWIPILGNIGDFAFKSNQANMNILLKHYHQAQVDVEEGEIVG